MSNFGSIRRQRKYALFPGELQFSDWQIFTKIAAGMGEDENAAS